MENPSRFLTGKLRHPDGFALLECLIVLTVISLSVPLALMPKSFRSDSYHAFSDAYFYFQSSAMKNGSHEIYEPQDQEPISFNEQGNVNRAKTLWFSNRSIIIELGGGRLVYR